MTINDWQQEVRRVNADHGWESKVTADDPKMFSEKMLLVISEIIEAMEEWRNHRGVNEIYYSGDVKESDKTGLPMKPEGIPIELADALIRIFDFAEANDIDLDYALRVKHKYNKTRSYRHGGKKA